MASDVSDTSAGGAYDDDSYSFQGIAKCLEWFEREEDSTLVYAVYGTEINLDIYVRQDPPPRQFFLDFLHEKAKPERLFRVTMTNSATDRPETGTPLRYIMDLKNQSEHQKMKVTIPPAPSSSSAESHMVRGQLKYLHVAFTWPGLPNTWFSIAGSPRPFKLETKAQVEDRQQIRRNWKPIGEGHYGITFHCKSVFTGEEFPLKEVPFKGSWNTAMAEIQPFLALNNCECICRLREFRVDEPSNRILLFFHYCKGGNLEQYLKLQRQQSHNSVLREYTLCVWLRRLLIALQAMERAEFVHIDIAPRNIFFLDVRHESPVLGDLGVAQALPRQGGRRSAVTVRREKFQSIHMAPEVYRRKRAQFTHACDLWSVACIIFQCLTLCDLEEEWAGGTHENMIAVINRREQSYTQPFRQLVIDMLRWDPAERPNATQALSRLVPIEEAACRAIGATAVIPPPSTVATSSSTTAGKAVASPAVVATTGAAPPPTDDDMFSSGGMGMGMGMVPLPPPFPMLTSGNNGGHGNVSMMMTTMPGGVPANANGAWRHYLNTQSGSVAAAAATTNSAPVAPTAIVGAGLEQDRLAALFNMQPEAAHAMATAAGLTARSLPAGANPAVAGATMILSAGTPRHPFNYTAPLATPALGPATATTYPTSNGGTNHSTPTQTPRPPPLVTTFTGAGGNANGYELQPLVNGDSKTTNRNAATMTTATSSLPTTHPNSVHYNPLASSSTTITKPSPSPIMSSSSAAAMPLSSASASSPATPPAIPNLPFSIYHQPYLQPPVNTITRRVRVQPMNASSSSSNPRQGGGGMINSNHNGAGMGHGPQNDNYHLLNMDAQHGFGPKRGGNADDQFDFDPTPQGSDHDIVAYHQQQQRGYRYNEAAAAPSLAELLLNPASNLLSPRNGLPHGAAPSPSCCDHYIAERWWRYLTSFLLWLTYYLDKLVPVTILNTPDNFPADLVPSQRFRGDGTLFRARLAIFLAILNSVYSLAPIIQRIVERITDRNLSTTDCSAYGTSGGTSSASDNGGSRNTIEITLIVMFSFGCWFALGLIWKWLPKMDISLSPMPPLARWIAIEEICILFYFAYQSAGESPVFFFLLVLVPTVITVISGIRQGFWWTCLVSGILLFVFIGRWQGFYFPLRKCDPIPPISEPSLQTWEFLFLAIALLIVQPIASRFLAAFMLLAITLMKQQQQVIDTTKRQLAELSRTDEYQVLSHLIRDIAPLTQTLLDRYHTQPQPGQPGVRAITTMDDLQRSTYTHMSLIRDLADLRQLEIGSLQTSMDHNKVFSPVVMLEQMAIDLAATYPQLEVVMNISGQILRHELCAYDHHILRRTLFLLAEATQSDGRGRTEVSFMISRLKWHERNEHERGGNDYWSMKINVTSRQPLAMGGAEGASSNTLLVTPSHTSDGIQPATPRTQTNATPKLKEKVARHLVRVLGGEFSTGVAAEDITHQMMMTSSSSGSASGRYGQPLAPQSTFYFDVLLHGLRWYPQPSSYDYMRLEHVRHHVRVSLNLFVLIVDDNQSSRYHIGTVMDSLGARALLMSTAAETLQYLQAAQQNYQQLQVPTHAQVPWMLVVDERLPHTSGYQLLRTLATTYTHWLSNHNNHANNGSNTSRPSSRVTTARYHDPNAPPAAAGTATVTAAAAAATVAANASGSGGDSKNPIANLDSSSTVADHHTIAASGMPTARILSPSRGSSHTSGHSARTLVGSKSFGVDQSPSARTAAAEAAAHALLPMAPQLRSGPPSTRMQHPTTMIDDTINENGAYVPSTTRSARGSIAGSGILTSPEMVAAPFALRAPFIYFITKDHQSMTSLKSIMKGKKGGIAAASDKDGHGGSGPNNNGNGGGGSGNNNANRTSSGERRSARSLRRTLSTVTNNNGDTSRSNGNNSMLSPASAGMGMGANGTSSPGAYHRGVSPRHRQTNAPSAAAPPVSLSSQSSAAAAVMASPTSTSTAAAPISHRGSLAATSGRMIGPHNSGLLLGGMSPTPMADESDAAMSPTTNRYNQHHANNNGAASGRSVTSGSLPAIAGASPAIHGASGPPSAPRGLVNSQSLDRLVSSVTNAPGSTLLSPLQTTANGNPLSSSMSPSPSISPLPPPSLSSQPTAIQSQLQAQSDLVTAATTALLATVGMQLPGMVAPLSQMVQTNTANGATGGGAAVASSSGDQSTTTMVTPIINNEVNSSPSDSGIPPSPTHASVPAPAVISSPYEVKSARRSARGGNPSSSSGGTGSTLSTARTRRVAMGSVPLSSDASDGASMTYLKQLHVQLLYRPLQHDQLFTAACHIIEACGLSSQVPAGTQNQPPFPAGVQPDRVWSTLEPYDPAMTVTPPPSIPLANGDGNGTAAPTIATAPTITGTSSISGGSGGGGLSMPSTPMAGMQPQVPITVNTMPTFSALPTMTSPSSVHTTISGVSGILSPTNIPMSVASTPHHLQQHLQHLQQQQQHQALQNAVAAMNNNNAAVNGNGNGTQSYRSSRANSHANSNAVTPLHAANGDSSFLFPNVASPPVMGNAAMPPYATSSPKSSRPLLMMNNMMMNGHDTNGNGNGVTTPSHHSHMAYANGNGQSTSSPHHGTNPHSYYPPMASSSSSPLIGHHHQPSSQPHQPSTSSPRTTGTVISAAAGPALGLMASPTSSSSHQHPHHLTGLNHHHGGHGHGHHAQQPSLSMSTSSPMRGFAPSWQCAVCHTSNHGIAGTNQLCTRCGNAPVLSRQVTGTGTIMTNGTGGDGSARSNHGAVTMMNPTTYDITSNYMGSME